MDEDRFTESKKPGGAHHLLSQLVGEWIGIAKTWFQPGILADESPIEGQIHLALDGRFAIHQYRGTLVGQEMNGLAIYGYDANQGIFQSVWIDNLHMGTGMMHSTGSADGQGFSVTGSYRDPGGGPDWGWRTVVEVVEPDHLVITAYNITPTGEEAKAVEIDYRGKTVA